jgi:hypothetical protein
MLKTVRDVNVSDMPDVLRLLDDIEHSGEALGLKVHGRVVAILEPAAADDPRIRRRTPSPEAIEAFRSAAGSWSEEQAEYVMRIINERRGGPPTDNESE